MVPALLGAAQTAAKPPAAPRVLLRAERNHPARVPADDRGERFRDPAHSRAAGAVSRSADDRQRPRQRGRRSAGREQRSAFARERLLAERHAPDAHRRRGHPGRNDDRSVRRRELGKETPLASLELALEPNFMVGNCEGGYSCAYINTLSWRTPTMPLPMETNPRVVFERLFGEGGRRRRRRAQLRRDRSLLDSVSEDLARLQRTLGPADQRTVNDYLDAVRDVEHRIQQTEQRADSSVEAVDGPLGIPDSFDEHAKLMFDLLLLAYQADITRVATFQIARELSLRSYPSSACPRRTTTSRITATGPRRMEKCSRINEFHMRLFAHLVEKMRATPDGDGTLLDHSMLLYGASMGDGNLHLPHNLPVALIGGGCGQLQGQSARQDVVRYAVHESRVEPARESGRRRRSVSATARVGSPGSNVEAMMARGHPATKITKITKVNGNCISTSSSSSSSSWPS